MEKNAHLENMTVEYISNNIFNLDRLGIKWLKQCCDRAVLDYAKKIGINYNLEWTLQGWANVNMRGDYHNLHNHPHSWLSGTYYVSVPDQAEAEADPAAEAESEAQAEAEAAPEAEAEEEGSGRWATSRGAALPQQQQLRTP